MNEQELKESRAKIEEALKRTPQWDRGNIKIKRAGYAIYLENRYPDEPLNLSQAVAVLDRLNQAIEDVDTRWDLKDPNKDPHDQTY